MISKYYNQAIKEDVRKIKGVVEMYLDGTHAPPTVFKGDDILAFDILEEVAAEGHVVFGYVSSNVLELKLNNINRDFTYANKEGIYSGKLKKGTKIVPYLGLETERGTEYVKMGSFYLADWRTPSNDTGASLTAYDRLYDVLVRETPNVPVQPITTLGRMFKLLFDAIGVMDYEIDSNLMHPIKLGWFNKESISRTLSDLCHIANCYVYVNREDKVVVQRALRKDYGVGKVIDEDNLFVSDNPQRVLNSYDRLVIEYNDVSVNKEDEVVVRLEDVFVPEEGLIFKDLEASSVPLCEITSINVDGNMIIEGVDYGALGVSFIVKRGPNYSAISGDEVNQREPYHCGIEIRGRTVTVNAQTIGEGEGKELLLKNHLMQNKAVAERYSEELLPYLTDTLTDVEFEYRGDPSIELYSHVTIKDDVNKVGAISLLPLRQRFSFDGTLRAYVTGRRLQV